jgi:hypothetical protein
MNSLVYGEVTITTAADGSAVVYSGKVSGRLIGIKYVPGSSQLATGTDLAIIGETSGQAILTKTNAGTSTVWYYPVAPANKVADAAASTLVEVPIYLLDERIKVTVAEGGDTKTGQIGFLVEQIP